MLGLEAATGALLFLALGIVIYGPWQWVCTDIARQALFEKRDAIFDIADSGRLSFESPQYRAIRRSLEKTIRFAHELTVPRICWALWKHRHDGQKSDLTLAIERIEDRSVREDVSRLVMQGLLAMIGAAALKSPLSLLVVLVFGGVAFFARRWRKSAKEIGEFVQAEAETADSLLVYT